jgi:hypothetical protein
MELFPRAAIIPVPARAVPKAGIKTATTGAAIAAVLPAPARVRAPAAAGVGVVGGIAAAPVAAREA